MSEETAAKVPAYAGHPDDAFDEWYGENYEPDYSTTPPNLDVAREAFRAAWEAAAPLRARIGELEDERDRLSDALNDNPVPALSACESQVEHFRELTAEILDTPEVRMFAPTVSYAEWRKRAGLES